MSVSHTSLRRQFLLDPDVVFLNHGSFGACPRPVFESYQRWQSELERQPVEFLGRRFPQLMQEARHALATYLNIDTLNLVFVPNATIGVNIVARSLPLEAGDEVLATDHEYGAMDRVWRFICDKRSAVYRRQSIPLPVASPEQVIEDIWSGVTPRTRMIFLSHITSPTALILPIAEICRRARQAGILTVIDGAHAPGQLELDLSALGADFYAGNCHKWLCAPKGSGFLYARPEVQRLLEPLVVSWGWESDRPGPSPFVDHHEWQGTRDVAAYLAVPDAIDFLAENDWATVRHHCHILAGETRERLAGLTGLPPIHPDDTAWYAQMIAAPLPACEAETLQERLYAEYRVEVPIGTWNERQFVRVSVQGYNTQEDIDILMRGLAALLPDVTE